MDPQIAAAAADERVVQQLLAVRRHAVSSGIVAAAVERPVVDAELAPDESGGQLAVLLGASQGNVCFASAEVADDLRRVELDHDVRMMLVKLAKQGGEEGDRIDLFGRDLHRAADVARLRRGGVGKAVERAFDLLRAAQAGRRLRGVSE